jgi:Pyruvate/2-oxoacid:ferredoxin oxidoreductase delta subunit
MTNKIFYFTGTGNSLAIARQLAESLGDTEIAPMASMPNGYTASDEERIGLVFPVFGWGMPRMAEQFARGLKAGTNQHVFAITTCGGTAGNTLIQLRKVLASNGTILNAGYIVSGDFLITLDPSNVLPIIKFMTWLGRNHKPCIASERLPELARAISERTANNPETSNASVNVIGSMMYRLAISTFKTGDKSFAASEKCNSCGVCTKVCPRENVTLEDGKPTWHHDCEMCNACIAWCPQKAITLGGALPTNPPHHASVSLSEALLR